METGSENNAIIGSTGFVGQNLQKQTIFTDCYHSQNISEIKGRHFDTMVCAAAPATMWQANKNPEVDLANIQNLVNHLKSVSVERVVLVSSVAVLSNGGGKYA